MPSKRRSNTSKNQKQLDSAYLFLIDRSLGAHKLSTQLAKAGIRVIVGDDQFAQNERDPWILYTCGKQKWIALTSDRAFMKSFPHMAAIVLGNTTVLAFTQNNFNSEVRGRAFIKAYVKVVRAIRRSKGLAFIGSIGMDGGFTILERSPEPQRKYCDEKDWESYEKACSAEGIQPKERHKAKGESAIKSVPA